MNNSPKEFKTEQELDNFLTIPYPETVNMMKRLEGDIIILGVGGKMGPTLARLAVKACKEACVEKQIIGVSRFSNKEQKELLETEGIRTIPCDLLSSEDVNKLPKIKNVIYMAGRKFGEVGTEPATWASNALIPGNVASAFKDSNIVMFSTGCVYEQVPTNQNGCSETDAPLPIGEYANSCLGRERIFHYYSQQYNTPVLMYRLNYAIDLRYGVLYDIAYNVYNDIPVDIAVNAVNIIWQGDANNRALLCLEHTACPPAILNITGKETLSVKDLALNFGKLFNKNVSFTGSDSGCAYLSNAQRSFDLFGPAVVSVEQMIQWVAAWIKAGGTGLGKPTHFQVTDGQFLDKK